MLLVVAYCGPESSSPSPQDTPATPRTPPAQHTPQSGTDAPAADLLTTPSSPPDPRTGGRPAPLRLRPPTVVVVHPPRPPLSTFSCTPASCCQACFLVAKRGPNERQRPGQHGRHGRRGVRGAMASQGHMSSTELGGPFFFGLGDPSHLCLSVRHKKTEESTVLDTLRQTEGRRRPPLTGGGAAP